MGGKSKLSLVKPDASTPSSPPAEQDPFAGLPQTPVIKILIERVKRCGKAAHQARAEWQNWGARFDQAAGALRQAQETLEEVVAQERGQTVAPEPAPIQNPG